MPAPQPDPSWKARVWQEFKIGNLTRAMRDVLLTLHTYRGTGGACWPAHTTLADRAGCCVRTVQRALDEARDLGLVSWCERRVRRGWRWLRTSNRYRLMTPAGEVQPGQRKPAWRPFTAPATTGQEARGGENKTKKEALQAVLAEAAALPDLLAIRRAAFEARHAATPPRKSGPVGQTICV
jgi:hypothetical protein